MGAPALVQFACWSGLTCSDSPTTSDDGASKSVPMRALESLFLRSRALIVLRASSG